MISNTNEWTKIKPYLAIGFLLSFLLSGIFSSIFPNEVRLEDDLWFGADIARVINDMAEPLADHNRLKVHPIFSLLILPLARPVVWIAKSAGLESGLANGIASQLIVSFSAGVSWILIYIVSFKLGLSKIKSFVIGLVFLSSSGFMFWWSTPESFPLGSVTILLPFLLLALGVNSGKIWLAVLIGSISMTITNWSAGLIASFARFGHQKIFYSLCLMTVIGTTVLVSVQKSYLPSAGLPYESGGHRHFINRRIDIAEGFYSFFVASIIPLSPAKIQARMNDEPQLQFAFPTANFLFPFRAGAAIAWTFLLFTGMYMALFRHRNTISLALVGFVGFQFLLHSIYGDTHFLYAAHYVPVMIILAGYGLAKSGKSYARFSTALAFMFVVLAFPLNIYCLLEAFRLGARHLAT